MADVVLPGTGAYPKVIGRDRADLGNQEMRADLFPQPLNGQLESGASGYTAVLEPICAVQFSADGLAIGCKSRVASFAPKNCLGATVEASVEASVEYRLFAHTSLIRRFRQSVTD